MHDGVISIHGTAMTAVLSHLPETNEHGKKSIETSESVERTEFE